MTNIINLKIIFQFTFSYRSFNRFFSEKHWKKISTNSEKDIFSNIVKIFPLQAINYLQDESDPRFLNVRHFRRARLYFK